MLNGDAIFDDNLKKIYDNHEKKDCGITFLGCSAKLNLGIVGKKNNKIVSFDRDIDFYSIKKKNCNNFTGYIYSGISIINTKILKLNFRNFNSNFIIISSIFYEICSSFWFYYSEYILYEII